MIFMIGFLTEIYSQNKKLEFQLSFGTTLSVPKKSKLTNTNLEGSPEIKSSMNIGAYILPTLNYTLSEKTSLDLGLGFYLDRFSIKDVIGLSKSTGNRNISQIQTPINFNYHFGKRKSYQLGIGGFVNFILSAKEKGNNVIEFSEFLNDSSDTVFNNNSTVNYNNDIKDNYNSTSFGGFIQLKKVISFSENKKGFILLKVNQHFNAIKNDKSNFDLIEGFEAYSEKEPTVINLGIGIIL